MVSTSGGVDMDDTLVPVSPLHPDNRWYPRLQTLRQHHRERFDAEPSFFVRVPGRVNIIGEHIDYCGYPVLPLAIDQCILLAVGRGSEPTMLELHNVNDVKYPGYVGHLPHDLRLNDARTPDAAPEWHQYFLCGIRGIHDALNEKETNDGDDNDDDDDDDNDDNDNDDNNDDWSMRATIDGDIAAGAGLSSSSALVSAAVLAAARLHCLPLGRKRLATIATHCERYIGTEGGGMDQSIAFLAHRGCAEFIEFQPTLRACAVRLPATMRFVVANSLVVKNKAASSDFNERVVECRLACCLLAKALHCANWQQLRLPSQLQRALDYTLQQMEEAIVRLLPQSIYSRHEIRQQLNVDDSELMERFLTSNTCHMLSFKLRQRLLHVVQEAQRVYEFRDLCQRVNLTESETCGDGPHPLIGPLSKLMQQSHESLRQLYECSHRSLDDLVQISADGGVSARLTGAGWGGCIVALCDSPQTSANYIELLKERYFRQLPADLQTPHQRCDFNDVVFATSPQDGAEIFTAIN